MEDHTAVFQLDVDLPVNKVPLADSRDNLKSRLKEQNLGPAKDGFMVVTTVTKADNVANQVSYQVVDGAAKPNIVFDAKKIFKNAGEGHSITLRKDFSAFSFEPNVNYSCWLKSNDLQVRFWRNWRGTIK